MADEEKTEIKLTKDQERAAQVRAFAQQRAESALYAVALLAVDSIVALSRDQFMSLAGEEYDNARYDMDMRCYSVKKTDLERIAAAVTPETSDENTKPKE